ncbi:MAG: N-acetyl-gamma-glutamyl-phosphate reductase, partial [Clostridia bacterium]|nr:N-acetyl-gamma-glutamyl-phosphate reductase [Clostridia bacterium]
WTYGFPELSDAMREQIVRSRRIAVPGCHASGFIALVRPLVETGLIARDVRLTCHSVTGYSGGGKKMIAGYEDQGRDPLLDAPRQYALSQSHKHLKEMQAMTGLNTAPIFCPIVADFYSGMAVTVPLFASDLQGGATADDIRRVYEKQYKGPLVRYAAEDSENGFYSAAALSGTDGMTVSVAGNDERILLLARYDNLGKGASGAAVECLNLVLGVDPTEGLVL